MQIIPLTKGRYAIVDDWAWHDIITIGSWCYDGGYARRGGRRVNGGREPPVLMHRIILELAGHDLNGLIVDHCDGDGLNNRLTNLRPANRAQNKANSRKHANNKAGFKGVLWCKRANKWQAYITVSGKRKHLGYYTDKIEAARAYDQAALTYFGDFAKTNFPRIAA